jgi:hypothetical protein
MLRDHGLQPEVQLDEGEEVREIGVALVLELAEGLRFATLDRLSRDGAPRELAGVAVGQDRIVEGLGR